MRNIFLFAVSCLAIIACNNNAGEKIKYVPVEDLKGEVKKVVTYSYESDIEKNKMIAQYGAVIPETIECYNKYGSLEVGIRIELPDEDEPQICYVGIDSVKFDKNNRMILRSGYVVLVLPNALSDYATPQLLMSSENSFIIRNNTRVEILEEKNKCIERVITEQSLDPDSFKALPYYMQNAIKERYFWRDASFLQTGSMPKDTITTIFEYDGKKVIRETEKRKDKTSVIERRYDGDNLIEEILFSGSDTTKTTFSYKNGHLNEKKVGNSVTRYDEKERVIAEFNEGMQQVTTYSDTTKIATYHSDRNGLEYNAVYFYRYNKDGLELFSSYLHLDDEDMYVDDAVLLFENFRDGQISESALREKMESIVYKINQSMQSSIEKKTYSNFDSHGNPLKIVKSRTSLTNNYSLYPRSSFSKYFTTKRVMTSESKQIIEREIEYYK